MLPGTYAPISGSRLETTFYVVYPYPTEGPEMVLQLLLELLSSPAQGVRWCINRRPYLLLRTGQRYQSTVRVSDQCELVARATRSKAPAIGNTAPKGVAMPFTHPQHPRRANRT